jgi:hypothetical protein
MPAPGTPGLPLPTWLWLWAPLLFLLTVPILLIVFPEHAQELIGEENGIPDLATPIVLVPAIIFGFRCHALRKQLPAPWLHVWLMLTTVACIYFAGEEISWGQSLFHWQTPEVINQINDQHETNLHNMSSWFDQKPRLLLALGVLIGGIVLPLRRKWKGTVYSIRDWRYWFWPDFVCLPAGLLAFVVRFPQRYENITGHWLFSVPFRTSEMQEFYFAFFLMLYLASCYLRLKKLERGRS